MPNKQPLKKSLTGFEVELFTVDREGYLAHAADFLLKKARQDKRDFNIKKEISLNMIEVASYPSEMIPRTMDYLLEELEYLTGIAERYNVLLCPLATYPGRYTPIMRTDRRYEIKKSIIGSRRYKIEGMCSGFHCHYDLPKGIFDSQLRDLKMLVRSKIKDSLVNSYNFMIAADPELTCFMQSSPFYQGRLIGKDSRVIMYRGGEALNNPYGLYADFEEFGGLPHYKLTALDIIELITTRYEKWKSYIISLGLNIKVLPLYGSILYTNWSPIRISPHGTLEMRGMDVNHPVFIAGIGVVIRFVLKKLQEEYFAVVPSEIGIKEPFKVEKDVVYIPPYPYVRNILQKLSAYKGLESDVVYNYCRRFLKFAESVMPKDRLKLTKPFKEMLNKRKTVSDEILGYARKKGYKRKEQISNKLAAEIALHHSGRLLREIIATREMINDLV